MVIIQIFLNYLNFEVEENNHISLEAFTFFTEYRYQFIFIMLNLHACIESYMVYYVSY